MGTLATTTASIAAAAAKVSNVFLTITLPSWCLDQTSFAVTEAAAPAALRSMVAVLGRTYFVSRLFSTQQIDNNAT